MFVVATRRPDFGRVWEKILKKQGEVLLVDGIDQLHALLRAHAVKLIMLDLDLPGGRDPSVLRKLVQECQAGKLMLGGIQFSPSAELAGLAVGAVACCGPDLPVSECKRMVEVILGGGVWLSSAGIPALVERLRGLSVGQSVAESSELMPSAPDPATVEPTIAEDGLTKLTRREREVAELVGSGASNKLIARKLLITDRTVKAHLTAIYDKLNISDRLQLALRVSAQKNFRKAVNE